MTMCGYGTYDVLDSTSKSVHVCIRHAPPPFTASGHKATTAKMLEPVEETDGVFTEPSPGNAPSSGPPQPAKREYVPSRPVAPVRMRMRMQKVKRPMSHNIPPPPNIPLPPPPVRRKVQSESDAKLLEESKPTPASPTPEESKKPPLKPKPAILPKPVHLAAAMRRHSESNVASQHSEESNAAPVPTPRKISKGPKPSPPTRTSSLSETAAARPLKRHKTSPLPSISDVVEETDSAAEGKKEDTAVAALKISESKVAVLKSNPPERPPPPRPRVQELDRDKRKSDPAVSPPLFGDREPTTNKSATLGTTPHGTVLFDASIEGGELSRDRGSAGSSLKAKGTNLMRSLKKMVKRSDSRKEESEKPVVDKRRTLSASDEGRSKPPRPSQPPKRQDSQPTQSKAEPSVASQQHEDTKSSPVPKPRAKPHVQETSEPSKQDEPEASGESGVKRPPPRPPPPGSLENGEAGGKKKDAPSRPAPSRPPPPKVQSSQQKAAVVNGDISVEKGIENGGPIPTPHPHNLDQTSTEEGTDSKPIPKPRKSVSPPPSSPVDSSRSSTNFYRATKDYTAQRDSELSFSSGDILIKIDCPSEEFYYGMLDDGTTGLFPVRFVEPFRSPS